jgi:hypothetical protein
MPDPEHSASEAPEDQRSEDDLEEREEEQPEIEDERESSPADETVTADAWDDLSSTGANGHRRPLNSRVKRLPQVVRVALGCYVVVVLFATGYGAFALIWPGLSTAGTVTAAALIAAPLALALLWPRLAGVKAFGFEVTLSRFEVGVGGELVAGITTEEYYSGAPEIVERVTRAIISPESELIEINLGAGDYWWSTRLYLLTALLSDYSSIEHFVIVEGRAQRRFLGFATLTSIRQALSATSPLLETIYRDRHAAVPANATRNERVQQVVNGWTAANFSADPKTNMPEKQYRQLVTHDLLHGWLAAVGKSLTRDAVAWAGETTPSLVRSIALEYQSKYVALLRETSLDRVVNRLDLTERIAARTLG